MEEKLNFLNLMTSFFKFGEIDVGEFLGKKIYFLVIIIFYLV